MTDLPADAATREQLAADIARLQRSFGEAAWRLVGPPQLPELTAQQFKVLRLVSTEPGMAASGVAHHLGVTAPTASGIVDRLADKGLLRRGNDPDDRRIRPLTLTDAGAAVITELDSAADRMLRALLPHLDTALLERTRALYLDLLAAIPGR